MSYTTIMIPQQGQPFIINSNFTEKKTDNALAELQKGVGGDICVISNPRDRVVVHPLFQERPAWRQAAKLLKKARKNSITLYANECGMFKCSPNMAMFVKHWDGNLRPLFGDMVVKISNNWWNKNRKNYTAIHASEEAMWASYENEGEVSSSDDSE